MKIKYLSYLLISSLLLTTVFISGCIFQKANLNNELLTKKLLITVDEGHAWYDLMPIFTDYEHPHISVPVTIKNKTGFNLNNITINKVEVIQDGEIVGDFKPWFQINYPEYNNSPKCYNASKYHPREFDLKKGCTLKFNIRANAKGDNTAGIDRNRKIKIRFKFIINGYSTKVYESNKMKLYETH